MSTERLREAGRSVAASPSWRQWVRAEWGFWRGVAYDAQRFRRHAWLHRVHSTPSRAARMLADAHFLEYGMALRAARPGFGLARAERLAGDLSAEGAGTEAAAIGLATLRLWADFNAGSTLPPAVQTALALPAPAAEAGTQTLTADTLRSATVLDFLAFAQARHSVRQFAPGPVPHDAIRRAVAAAQAAPSSCNRQTCHAHVWTDPALINRVRSHQAGNRTFGHELGGIAVITSDLRHWEHAGERYQAWIDGGLFAMSLAHGLHAEGLGTCFLNWSVEPATDRALRAEIGLDDAQLVIVLLGFGLMPDSATVCASPRLPVEAAFSLNPPLA
ncbi:nitroreductase family protein [Pararhodobacter zhoushanensis]|uniref:Nitroreductase family protein n=1 Tax=Pararhodobacter zhoushanensis TaxID=2479545 RepID=A0ABT3H5I7_9RHOB|nr:nitroreductase family protein [Pararhodobacter zhoushanensis]MCW1935005.1 nitroreductase family protein [Pararhodobacter zhoushanensis]